MGRIIFLNAFSKDEFSGGIKTTYRHAAMLNEEGIEACVLQPEGPPVLLQDPVQRALACREVTIRPDDVVVYPEAINGWYEKAISEEMSCTKVMFCQNPFYLYSYEVTGEQLKEWKIECMIVPSQWARESVRSVMGFNDIRVVTPVIDTKLFCPRSKKLNIVSASWKWNDHPVISSYRELIQKIFVSKYPELADIPWVELSGYKEAEVAHIMGESAVCLVLGAHEALGMTALEAMASECITVGFHGGGGLDFATSQNGFWHSPEDIEGVVDSLALVIEGEKYQSARMKKIRHYARLTAQYYNNERSCIALKETYQDLLNHRHVLTHL